MQKESLLFFSANGFYSFLSADEEFLAFCHNKKIGTKSYNIFQLIDLHYNTEKFWVEDNKHYASLHLLLEDYPVLKVKAALRLNAACKI
jgi:hypothetical protein